MDNLIARQKEKAKDLVELFFYPWIESSLEYAKKCAIRYCDAFIRYTSTDNSYPNKSYWEGIKTEIEKFEISNTLIYRNQKYMISLLNETNKNIKELKEKTNEQQ